MNLTALALVPVALVSVPDVREEILVVVNNHIITRRTYQQAVEQATAALYRELSGKALDEKLRASREKVLQGLIDAFLLEDKAADLSIVIPEEYIRGNIEELKKQNNFSTDADLEKALRSQFNTGLPEYIKRMRQQITQEEVLGREVRRKIAVDDQELLAYYEDHRDEYKQPSRFRIRELVLSKGATTAEQEAARKVLASIQEELKAGKAFEELAKVHSTSPSKATGGDIGWMGKGLMRANIEKTALALKPGQVSEVIETDKDIMLIQLVGAEENVVKPFADVRAQILEKLQEPKAENAMQNYLSNLRVRANIRYLVPKETILKG